MVQGPVDWQQFIGDIATVAEVGAGSIDGKTRLLEDLALDSLALTELVVLLADRYGLDTLLSGLEDRGWANVSVRSLYDELFRGRPQPGRVTIRRT